MLFRSKTVKAADTKTDSVVAITVNTVAAADQTKHECNDSCMSSGTCPMHNKAAAAAVTKDVSVYHLKVIKSSNKYFDRALWLNDTTLITHDSVDVVTNIDGVKKATKEERLQTWNPKPEKPYFIHHDFKIETLYDFFMLFVFMAGAASIVLFFLSSRLLKMMNGVR